MSAEAVVGAGTEVTKGEHARMASFVGAIAIADMVKTTLGPKGMDKILQSVRLISICKISMTRRFLRCG
jgi:T-complex protein 1 subunit beta